MTREKHPHAGEVVTIKLKNPEREDSSCPINGKQYKIEDWWANVHPTSQVFMAATEGNFAALNYIKRVSLGNEVPAEPGNEVYGHIDGLGFIVHETEINYGNV